MTSSLHRGVEFTVMYLDIMNEIELTSFSHSYEADIFGLLLRDNEIDYRLEYCGMEFSHPMYGQALGGTKVFIIEENIAEASRLLKDYYKKDRTCPQCGSNNIINVTSQRPMNMFMKFFVNMLLGGLPIMRLKSFQCRDCKNNFE